ncbi:MAG: OmpA family protein [Deltaproteobacteria bacterium]|nr:OmpA family protein [Deltaproteobacteria bacterium]
MRVSARVGVSSVLLAAIGCLGASVARAQTTPPNEGAFSIQTFRVAPGLGNYLTVDGAQVGAHLTITGGLFLSYAMDPFVIYDATCTTADADASDCDVDGTRTTVVSTLFTGEVVGSITLLGRLQIGLAIPVNYLDGDGFDPETGQESLRGGVGTAGLGDIRLTLKAHILEQSGLGLAAALFVTGPLGAVTVDEAETDRGAFAGESGLTVGGRGIVEYRQRRFSLAANLGFLVRPDEPVLFSTEVGHRMQYGVAGQFFVTPRISILGELYGDTGFSSEVDENPLEGLVAGRYRLNDLVFTLGAGAGLVAGIGVPTVRVFGGAMYAPDRTDSDGDGILDGSDSCPSDPEDRDEWEDEDGCPEADNDGDGFPDGSDRCPNEAEDRDQFEDDNGCPDPDNDGDGVRDGFDSCPMEPEDRDGDRDEDGCPDNDRDRDGIADPQDQCPDEPEDTDGFGDDDGCPETDFDGDGLPDDGDECPDQPETRNGFEDDNGCPDEAPDTDGDGIADPADRCPERPETLNGVDDEDGCPDGQALVRIEGDRIRLLQQVNFATDSDRIVGRRSFQILDAVIGILTRHPEYRRVRIEGHTDNTGDEAHNRDLSRRRAAACATYLTEHGIVASRLESEGFGPDRPIEPNTTRRGRAANRRVEFHIVPVGPSGRPVAPTGAGTGATPSPGGTGGARAPAAPATPAAGTSPSPTPARRPAPADEGAVGPESP